MIRLGDFRPAPLAVDARERARIVVGAGLGMLLTAALCHVAGIPAAQLGWLIAPMGASAVLVFGVPASPLAQPWSVVGGNTLSALIGIGCARWVAPVDAAAALAVALAIGVMIAARCLHPPGGASALLMALGGITDWHAALFPVLANSLLLAACGVVWNNATRRPYPHPQRLAPAPRLPATEDDLDAVLARYNQVLDVSRDDLLELLAATQLRSQQRRLAQVRCADIMSRELVTVEFGTTLQDAWALMRAKGIKALPVVDRWRHLVGIVTLADFMKAADLDLHHGFDARLRRLIRATPGIASDKPEVVGQIMTRRVRVTRAQRPLADLLPLLGATGHHHIPVLGDDSVERGASGDGADRDRDRVVGMITQTDVVRALAAPA